MLYVDGLITALPAVNQETYRRLLQDVVPLIRAYGAINIVQCGDQESSSYLDLIDVHCANKVVMFSWIVWPSKAMRDRGMQSMLADPRFENVLNPVMLGGERIELDTELSLNRH
ncbi:DUF1428 family protein [Enterovibrio norvegicus]|uniref:Uncharacterized conserved protein YbaA, DUF1428 family n=1 Tax=Enterovibrio norvegicus DSM 15893 TaxID=1121869 RepID=A0A1I5KD05_9GAMM|nr:DUF1428 family protein [Enterovibrio norvegicus]SFO82623.1 Uncharacterized conserved protein YbaA, DUF1428 family [Enterovibrio norvegicus DSM 15893]